MNELLIGHLTDIQGQCFQARLTGHLDPHLPILKIGQERVLVGQLSSHVAIRQGNIHLLAMVTRIQEGEKDANQNRYRMLTLLPLGEVDHSGTFLRGVRNFPTIGAEVHAIGSSGTVNSAWDICTAIRTWKSASTQPECSAVILPCWGNRAQGNPGRLPAFYNVPYG